MAGSQFATWMAGIITFVWVASLITDAAWPAYEPPVTIHALMMAAAGWAFAGGYIRRQEAKNGNKKHDREPDD